MNNNRQIALVVILIISSFFIGVLCGYKLSLFKNEPAIESETSQNPASDPSSLQASLNSNIQSDAEASISASGENQTENIFDYLAIGNSITRHSITEFWWNDVGMAASDADHDYYHIVLKYLEDNYGNVNSSIFNLAMWESQAHDRDETLEYLEPYLSTDLDLITIQLGENVSDLTTYQKDYVALLKFIRSKAPNARILVVEDFWTNEERNKIEINACAMTDAEYVSLDGIANNRDYYRGMGTTVYDKYGNEHTVEHEGVAMHPGDAGMKAIAERIISTIEN